jgi:hypothetical protein
MPSNSENPYSAPQVLDLASEPLKPKYQYKRLDDLTILLSFLLIIGLAVTIGSTYSSYLQLDLLTRAASNQIITQEEAQLNDNREAAFALAYLLVFLGTVIVFGIWIVRAHRNLVAVNVRRLQFTPGWSLGYFFVPIMNLFQPYQAMKELWQASHAPFDWHGRNPAPIVGAWWLFWILSNIQGSVANRFINSEDIDTLILGTSVEMAGILLYLPLTICALGLIRGVNLAQREHLVSDPRGT